MQKCWEDFPQVWSLRWGIWQRRQDPVSQGEAASGAADVTSQANTEEQPRSLAPLTPVPRMGLALGHWVPVHLENLPRAQTVLGLRLTLFGVRTLAPKLSPGTCLRSRWVPPPATPPQPCDGLLPSPGPCGCSPPCPLGCDRTACGVHACQPVWSKPWPLSWLLWREVVKSACKCPGRRPQRLRCQAAVRWGSHQERTRHFGLKLADVHCVRNPTGFGVRDGIRRGPRGSCWDSRVRSSTPRADGGPGSEARVWKRGQLIRDEAMRLLPERRFLVLAFLLLAGRV